MLFFFFNASLYYLHLFCAIVNHSPKKKKGKTLRCCLWLSTTTQGHVRTHTYRQ